MARSVDSSRLGRALFVAAAVVAGWACNGITGASELQEEAIDPDSGAGVTTTPPDLDGGVVKDSAADVYVEPPKACPSAGRSCVPSAPPTWQGPLLVFEGAADLVPPCPSSMALEKVNAKVGTPSGSISCDKCGCGPVANVTCGATVHQFVDDQCLTVESSATPLTTTCQPLTNSNIAVTVTTAASGGGCAPMGGGATKEPVKWAGALRACGAPALLPDGCQAGEVCVPDSPAPFRAQRCIAHDGDVACPAPWTDRHMAATDVDDTRECTKCSCKPPQNVSCDGTGRLSVAGDPTCAPATSTSHPIPMGCHSLGAGASVKIAFGTTIMPSGGFCPKEADSQPTGGLAPKGPVTVCCVP